MFLFFPEREFTAKVINRILPFDLFPLQKFSKEVEKLLGTRGTKLFEKRKDKNFLKEMDQLAMDMRGFQKEPGNLKEYSPWLSSFKADTFDNELEIPGQLHRFCRLSHRPRSLFHLKG